MGLSTRTEVSDLPWHVAVDPHPSQMVTSTDFVFFLLEQGIPSHRDSMAENGLPYLLLYSPCLIVQLFHTLLSRYSIIHQLTFQHTPDYFQRSSQTMTSRRMTRPLLSKTGCNFHSTAVTPDQIDYSTEVNNHSIQPQIALGRRFRCSESYQPVLPFRVLFQSILHTHFFPCLAFQRSCGKSRGPFPLH